MGVIKKTRNGNVVLLHRGDSPFCILSCQETRRSRLGAKSTGTSDIEEALEFAEELYDDVRFKAKHGLALEPKAFDVVADVYVNELKDEIALGVRHERHLKDYGSVVERYLKPYFGDRPIDTITNKDIAAYQNGGLLIGLLGEKGHCSRAVCLPFTPPPLVEWMPRIKSIMKAESVPMPKQADLAAIYQNSGHDTRELFDDLERYVDAVKAVKIRSKPPKNGGGNITPFNPSNPKTP